MAHLLDISIAKMSMMCNTQIGFTARKGSTYERHKI
jgi:hypothetical protein